MNEEIRELTRRIEKIECLLEQLTKNKYPIERDDGKPISMKQAAYFLHLSISRIYGLIYEGKLTPIQRKRKNKILFSKDELKRFLKETDKSITSN